MQIRILPAKNEDIDGIYRMIRLERKYLLYRSKANIQRHLKNFIVAKKNNDLIACASFEKYSPEIAELRSLVVLPQFRGRFIGKKIIRMLLKRKQKHQKVFVVTSKVAYFEHLGFHNALKEKYVLFKR